MGRQLLGAFLACALVLAAVPQVCLACSCRTLPPDEAIAKADVIFRGWPGSIHTQEHQLYMPDGSSKSVQQKRITFDVTTVWKGPPVPQMSVSYSESSGACAMVFTYGQEYLVFATWSTYWRDSPPTLNSFICSGTRKVGDASDYLGALGAGLPAGSGNPPYGVAHGFAIGAYEAGAPAAVRGAAVPPSGSVSRPAMIFASSEVGSALALAVDREGYVYALDVEHSTKERPRIRKFAPDGELVALIGGRPLGSPDVLAYLNSLAVDSQRNLYVAGSYGVAKIAPSGEYVQGWTLLDIGETSRRSGLIVVDSADRVHIGDYTVDQSGAIISRWSRSEQGPAPWVGNYGKAIDRQGNVYYTDNFRDHIRKYSPDGDLLAEWGKRGDGPGEFNSPFGIAVDAWGNIYVADAGNDRVQQLSTTGNFVAAWGGAGGAPGQFRRPLGLAVDERGNVYVTDSGNFRIQRIPAAGAP